MLESSALLSLFLIGLSYGSTACMFTCMPFLSPLLLTNSSTLKSAMGVMIPFSIGRVFAYILIALIASFSAFLVKDFISNPKISQIILGSATILVSLYIFKNSFSKNGGCCTSKKDNSPKTKVGYFFMGAGISLNPCVPVMTLITTSAYATSSFEAISFGLVFAIGTVGASFLIFGFIVSKMASEIMMEFAKYKTIIQRVASILLFTVGIATINGFIHL
jgi:sulfite exporter TauE/SafE